MHQLLNPFVGYFEIFILVVLILKQTFAAVQAARRIWRPLWKGVGQTSIPLSAGWLPCAARVLAI